MDSPEATNSPPSVAAASSPVVQDSPFFTFVSNLSPIKPGNDVCGPSAFRELNFPSPYPVFTSPHVNPIRKENLLKRCQYPSPDSGKLCLNYSSRVDQFSANTSPSGYNAAVSRHVSVPCIMKDSECDFSIELRSSSTSSPSGCADEFLADPMEDLDDSISPALRLEQSTQPLELSHDRHITSEEEPKEFLQSQNNGPSGCVNEVISTNQTEHAIVSDKGHSFSAHGLSQDTESKHPISGGTDSSLNSQNNDMKQCCSKICDMPIKDMSGKNSADGADEDRMSGGGPLNQHSQPLLSRVSNLVTIQDQCEGIGEESFVVPNNGEVDTMEFDKENVPYPLDMQNSNRDASDGKKLIKLDFTPNLEVDLVKIMHRDNKHDIPEDSCNTSARHVISCEQEGLSSKLLPEGCLYQRALCKRLEFDYGPSNSEILHTSTAESANMVEGSQSAPSFSRPHPNKKTEDCLDKVARSIQTNGSSVMTNVRRPCGIGLHLNSIVNVMSKDIHINMQSGKDLEKDNLNSSMEVAPSRGAPKMIDVSEVYVTSLTSVDEASTNTAADSHSLVTVPRNCDNDQQGSQETVLGSSSSNLPSQMTSHPLKKTLRPEFLEHSIVPCNMKRQQYEEDASGFEEPNDMSPRNKRQKTSEDVDCKRCNCKKSKCLKLYCDCFAAGVYCADACACQGCLNRPEFEDTVLETRHQIESRNPLAFVPKVIVRAAETITDGEVNKDINSTSARHKRGCNCKRSRCLKKYCECFQAKVGCSLGCRCEGCKNTYGKKDGFETVESEDTGVRDEKSKHDPSDGTNKMNVGQLHDKHLSHLSPFTPLLECSNGGKFSKFQHAAKRYQSSPESSTAVLFSHGKSKSSPTKAGDGRAMKTHEGNQLQCPYHKELDINLDEDETVVLSSKWERLAERSSLRLLPSCSPSDPTEKINKLRAPISHCSGRLSVGSIIWHSSPVTPMPRFGESKFSLESCSDSEALNAHEDDTPDILKDSCMIDKRPKMSSPNKKRVSPPHKHVNVTKASSSGMRSRKFILKSVPSFPSLTPCVGGIAGVEPGAHKTGP